MIRHASWEGVRPYSNDDRLALWASRYYAGGHHHMIEKPRIRIIPGESVADARNAQHPYRTGACGTDNAPPTPGSAVRSVPEPRGSVAAII